MKGTKTPNLAAVSKLFINAMPGIVSLGPAMMLLGSLGSNARKFINILEGVVTFINISYTKFIVT